MNKLLNNKNLTIINFSIVSYFLMIWLFYINQVKSVILGVFTEMFSIPFLIAQVVFLILGIRFIIKEKSTLLTKVSLLLLAICTILTLGSFY